MFKFLTGGRSATCFCFSYLSLLSFLPSIRISLFLLSFFRFLSNFYSSSFTLNSFFMVRLSATGDGKLPNESPRNSELPRSCRIYSRTIYGRFSSLPPRFTFIISSFSTSRFFTCFLDGGVALANDMVFLALIVLSSSAASALLFFSYYFSVVFSHGIPCLNSSGSSCALMKSNTMSSSSLRLNRTSNDVSLLTAGN